MPRVLVRQGPPESLVLMVLRVLRAHSGQPARRETKAQQVPAVLLEPRALSGPQESELQESLVLMVLPEPRVLAGLLAPLAQMGLVELLVQQVPKALQVQELRAPQELRAAMGPQAPQVHLARLVPMELRVLAVPQGLPAQMELQVPLEHPVPQAQLALAQLAPLVPKGRLVLRVPQV